MNSFNTNAIVYDNTPWRPGREIDLQQRSVDDERKLKNLATRVMSNGVEVLVRDKNLDGKQEQRKLKLMQVTSLKPSSYQGTSTSPSKLLLSSAVATVVNRQHMSAFFPLHQFMQHNYIIKTCMTTYTYLTTVVQNKRSAVSTFETIVSVVTTESLTNLYAPDILADLKPTKTKYMEVKTIQPSISGNMYVNNAPKIDKRIDNSDEDNFDLIQPSEIGHVPCTTSCSCSHTKTESLKTRYTNKHSVPTTEKYALKTTKYTGTKFDVRPTHKESHDKTQNHPYEYETSSEAAPTDKIVEKYTQVNDYSDEKDSNSVEESELLTNEKAPPAIKINKVPQNKTSEKVKPEKPTKVNKNKLVVAELIKLGSLGIKGLSQLAPVIEKMTGGFMKRQENKTTLITTTVKPVTKLTPYNANKRADTELETKQGNFPIYIPVDEMEVSESQIAYTNATLHQNFAWAAEHKYPKAPLIKPKIVHESPLVNGGIPISPGEIITAHSDVIVGTPAVGGPLNLVTSGIKLHNNAINPPPGDSAMANNELYITKERPPQHFKPAGTETDDSFDLRPPELPKSKQKPNKNLFLSHGIHYNNQIPVRMQSVTHISNDPLNKPSLTKNNMSGLVNHGRPAFLDYIPTLTKPTVSIVNEQHGNYRPSENDNKDQEIADSNPSSSEFVSMKITADGKYADFQNSDSASKPFLVDIQPSRVANVLIPHGSSTALVFAGSSEPHKTGDYIDDPLPYPEPGYFGSFSIDAPHMTNVHNVVPNKSQFSVKPSLQTPSNNKPIVPKIYKESPPSHEYNIKWDDNKHQSDLTKLPLPTSNQETHVQVGPQVTVYNPEIYNGDFNKHNQVNIHNKPKEGKGAIDKEYENYLAVPPPPPKMHYNQESRYDKSKLYHQRPTIHTKPIHDSKTYLNIQHPVSSQLPPKVTSEIYFASQMPNSQPTPTYTFKMPSLAENQSTKKNHQLYHVSDTQHYYNNYPVSAHSLGNKSITMINNKENTYTITLNTAANIANNKGTGHVMGSSISVPITTTSHNGQINANIPIGTNFAIRVEDDPAKYETVALHGKRQPSIIYDDHSRVPNEFNTYIVNSTIIESNITHKLSDSNQKQLNGNKKPWVEKPTNNENILVMPPSLNSHANFPVINDKTNEHNIIIKTDERNEDGTILYGQQKPAKISTNNSTNSHGWYSSILKENKLKNIQVEATTRKLIPLHYDNVSDSLPEFGEKIATVGKPPSDYWEQKQKINNFSVGKPFSKQKEIDKQHVLPFTIRPNYIPSIFGTKQPAYDIPVRDNSDETSTRKIFYSKPIKPVYETADEIYDGEEEVDINGESDGEVSSESMKVPVVSSSVEKGNQIAQKQNNSNINLVNFNPGTQTEKPFNVQNKTTFQSNNIRPIYSNSNYNMKPRPFTVNTIMPLDHQLQQPHWQINQLMENATNISYEDNVDLNIGEEMFRSSTSKPTSTKKTLLPNLETLYSKQQKLNSSPNSNTSRQVNESNIITSTVHINDKKPLILEVTEKSTLPTFTINTDSEIKNSSEILDLSPPPPTIGLNLKPPMNDEIMGMSPPPPRTSPPRYPSRASYTPRPAIPVRTPPPYRTLPPRTLAPRPSTQKPTRKPINKDEVTTHRPTYDTIKKMKQPIFNYEQPSSQLQPPPREQPSKIALIENLPSPTSTFSMTNVVFPTPLSSGWLTSSHFDFSSSFNFAPTSVYFEDSSPSKTGIETDIISADTSSENFNGSYEYESSSEIGDFSSENPVTERNQLSPNNTDTEDSQMINNNVNFSENIYTSSETSQENEKENVKDSMKVIPIGNKNRTRKPYPHRVDDKKSSTSKYKLPTKATLMIRPTRTLSYSNIAHPTRTTTVKKIIRPLPSRPIAIYSSSIIESSESSFEEDFIKPTEVLRDNEISTNVPEITSVIEKTITSTLTINRDLMDSKLHPTHHAGNEIKISDEIIPTKTEFKTTVITLTKTLSEPPQTVSSIGYVNLTHTLTVTHTKTSLVSQSEGAVTQTLVLTNTHTSTVVDVVTEVYTQVQPTTIVETVTKHIPIHQVEATPVQNNLPSSTKIALDDISMSSEESNNFIIRNDEATENIQKIEVEEEEKDNDTFFVVMNKSQNGGKSPPISTDIETGDYDGITRNEQTNNNGVSQVLFGEILLAGTPFLETTNIGHPTGIAYGKECQPDCKASRNERCQRIDGIMKCVCRPGFARMFPDRPCKPTYTYSVSLALGSQGNERLKYQTSLSNNASKEYHKLALATHEGINRMIMQSDLRDVYHGVHITGFNPVEIRSPKGEVYQGVTNTFYVQLSDNAHESRLKEVIEKYLRNNNYSLGGTEVHAAEELMDKLNVSDFDECGSTQFHDCSEHARCFNLRGTYTCSCLEGFADLSVNTLYPGRICSSEAVGCSECNYHGTCFERESATICECFKWYAGRTCQVNLKAVLITVTVIGAIVIIAVTIWASKRCCCQRSPATQTFVIGCMQGMPSLHQGAMPSKQRADRRALIAERMETMETSSVQNTSLPYIPSKQQRSSCSKKCVVMSEPPSHAPPPPPAPALMIPRARLHPLHSDSRDNLSRRKSSEICSEAKLISYLESGTTNAGDEMRRKHSVESSYSVNKERSSKQGALVSAGFKVSTTIRPDDNSVKEDRDDASSVNKTDLEAELSRFDTLRKSYSQEDMSEWTDAERRIGELTLSEARSVGGTLPASTGRAASSTRLTHQENTMAERELGSTFLLPHVHLYKPDLTSDVSEFDSL